MFYRIQIDLTFQFSSLILKFGIEDLTVIASPDTN